MKKSTFLLILLAFIACEKDDDVGAGVKPTVIDITPESYKFFLGEWHWGTKNNPSAHHVLQFYNDSQVNFTFNSEEPGFIGITVKRTLLYNYTLGRDRDVNYIFLERPDTQKMEGGHVFSIQDANSFKFDGDLYIRQ